MTTGLYKIGLVLVIICLFIGAGFLPSITGNNNFNGPPSIEWDKTYGGTRIDLPIVFSRQVTVDIY